MGSTYLVDVVVQAPLKQKVWRKGSSWGDKKPGRVSPGAAGPAFNSGIQHKGILALTCLCRVVASHHGPQLDGPHLLPCMPPP